jgi:two-component system sensor histidine kinase YesM
MIAGEENAKFTFEGEENVGVYLRIEMPVISEPNTEGDSKDDA